MFHSTVFPPMTSAEKLLDKVDAAEQRAPLVVHEKLQRMASIDFYTSAATAAASGQCTSMSSPAVSTTKSVSSLGALPASEFSSLLERLKSAATGYYFNDASVTQAPISIPVQQQQQLQQEQKLCQQNSQLHNAEIYARSSQLYNMPSTSASSATTLNAQFHEASVGMTTFHERQRQLAANQALLNSILEMQFVYYRQKIMAEQEMFMREQQLHYNSQLLYKTQQQSLISSPLVTTSAAMASMSAVTPNAASLAFCRSDTNIKTPTTISNCPKQQQYRLTLEYLRKQHQRELLLEYERLLSKQRKQQELEKQQKWMTPWLAVKTAPSVGSAFRAYRDALVLDKSDAALVDFSEEENATSFERRHTSADLHHYSGENTTFKVPNLTVLSNNIIKQQRLEQQPTAKISISMNSQLQVPNSSSLLAMSSASAIVAGTTLSYSTNSVGVLNVSHNSTSQARLYNEDNEDERVNMPQLLPECVTFDANDYDNSAPPPLYAFDVVADDDEIDGASATQIKYQDCDKSLVTNAKSLTPARVFAPLSIDCSNLQVGTKPVDCCYLPIDAAASSSSITPPPESPQSPLLAFADVCGAYRTDALQTVNNKTQMTSKLSQPDVSSLILTALQMSAARHGMLSTVPLPSENREVNTTNDPLLFTSFAAPHGALSTPSASSNNSVDLFSEFLPVSPTEKHILNLVTLAENDINTSSLKSMRLHSIINNYNKKDHEIDKSLLQPPTDEMKKNASRIENSAEFIDATTKLTSDDVATPLISEERRTKFTSKRAIQSHKANDNGVKSSTKDKKAPKINKTPRCKLESETNALNANVSVISIAETVKQEERRASSMRTLSSPNITRKNAVRKAKQTKNQKHKKDSTPKLAKFFPIITSAKNAAHKSTIAAKKKNIKRKIIEKDKMPAVKPKKSRCDSVKQLSKTSITVKKKKIDTPNHANASHTANYISQKKQSGYNQRRRLSSSKKVPHCHSRNDITKLLMSGTRKNKHASLPDNDVLAVKKEVKRVQAKQSSYAVNIARSMSISYDKTMSMRASQKYCHIIDGSGKRRGPKIRSAASLKIVSNWRPIGEGQFMALSCGNEGFGVRRRCFDAIRHWSELDVVVRVGDCVKICSAEDLENIGKIVYLYYDETSKAIMITVLWYYTRFQIDTSRGISTFMMHKKELLASKHVDTVNADCIEGLVYVLTYNEYCRFLAESRQRNLVLPKEFESIWTRADGEYSRRAMLPLEDTPHDLLYFCRAIYSIKTKRLCYTVYNNSYSIHRRNVAKRANHLCSRRLKYKNKCYQRKSA